MLFVGDDWAEDHHDIELVDDDGPPVGAPRGCPRASTGIDPAARVGRRAPGRGLGRARARTAAGAGEGRHRDRPRPVGRGPGRGGVRGVRDQPDVGGPLPGTALHLRGEVRCRRRAPAGRDRPPRPGPPPSARRRLAERPRRSSWSPAPIRAWSGTAPGTCCGCGRRCGTSSPPRCEAFPDLDAPDALELLVSRARPGPRRAADHGARSPRRCGGRTAAQRRGQGRRDPARSCAPRSCAARRRCRSAYAAIVASQVQRSCRP